MYPIEKKGSGRHEETLVVKVSAETTQSTVKVWGPVTPRPAQKSEPGLEDGGSGSLPVKESSREKTNDPPMLQELSLDSFVCRAVSGRLVCYSLYKHKCVILAEGRGERPDTVIVRPGGQTMLPVCNSFEVLTEV